MEFYLPKRYLQERIAYPNGFWRQKTNSKNHFVETANFHRLLVQMMVLNPNEFPKSAVMIKADEIAGIIYPFGNFEGIQIFE